VTGLLGGGSDLLAEVAQPDFDSTEQLVLGSIDERIRHLVHEGKDLSEELLAQALAALVAGFNNFRDRRRGCCRSS
jgi:hypothetical protein